MHDIIWSEVDDCYLAIPRKDNTDTSEALDSIKEKFKGTSGLCSSFKVPKYAVDKLLIQYDTFINKGL